MRPVLLMVDLSSNNKTPNLLAHYKAGYRVVAFKATEGTGYTWDRHGALSDEAHRLGFRVVHYHFATAGPTGVSQAVHFLAAVKAHLKPGDVICLDIEGQPESYSQWRPGEAQMVAKAFMTYCDTHAPKRIRKWVYGTFYFLRDSGIKPLKRWRLWIAGYQAAHPATPPGWRKAVAWQYTSAASGVPGVSGAVDQSHIQRTLLPGVVAKLVALSKRDAAAADVLTEDLSDRPDPLDPTGRATLIRLRAAIRKALKKGKP